MKPDTLIKRHVFHFNKEDNGGEAILLKTEFLANGDPGEFYINQELSLQSYGNSASFNFGGGPLTPEILRQLADELDDANMQASEACKPPPQKSKEEIGDVEFVTLISELPFI